MFKRIITMVCLYWLFLSLIVLGYNAYEINKQLTTARKNFSTLTPTIARVALYQTQYNNQNIPNLEEYKNSLKAQSISLMTDESDKDAFMKFIDELNVTENRPENFSLAYLNKDVLKEKFNNMLQEQIKLSFSNEMIGGMEVTTDVNLNGPYLTTWDGKVRDLFGNRFDNYHDKISGGSTTSNGYTTIFNYKEYTVVYVANFNIKVKLQGKYWTTDTTNNILEAVDSDVDIYSFTIPYMLFN